MSFYWKVWHTTKPCAWLSGMPHFPISRERFHPYQCGETIPVYSHHDLHQAAYSNLSLENENDKQWGLTVVCAANWICSFCESLSMLMIFCVTLLWIVFDQCLLPGRTNPSDSPVCAIEIRPVHGGRVICVWRQADQIWIIRPSVCGCPSCWRSPLRLMEGKALQRSIGLLRCSHASCRHVCHIVLPQSDSGAVNQQPAGI